MNNNVKSMQQAIRGVNSLEPNVKSRLRKLYTGELKPTKNDVNSLTALINSLNARGWTGVANKLRKVLKNANLNKARNLSPSTQARNMVARVEKNTTLTENRLNGVMDELALMNIPHLLRGQLARRLNNVRRGLEIHNSIKALNLSLNNKKRLQAIYNGRVKMTANDVSFVAAAAQELTANGFNKVGMELYILLANAPLKTNWNKLNVSKLPKTLYHGSGTLLKQGYPNKPGGTWFAKSPHQSILHAVARSSGPKYLYVYHFRAAKPKLIDIKTSDDFYNLGVHLTRSNRNFAFSNENYMVAKDLCRLSKELGADGWHFPRDQDQIMLCEPKKFLRLHRVYTIEGAGAARSPNFKINWAANEARWKRPRGLRYGLKNVPIRRKKNVAAK